MTRQELIDQQADAFKAWLRSRGLPKPLHWHGSSGPLGDVFLDPHMVDEMDAAIDDAFERTDAGPELMDDQRD